jgi:hypothetical protein
VAAIFAQMRGDAVGSRLDCQLCGAHGIWRASAARVAKRRDVIDIDPKTERRNVGHLGYGPG